MPRRGSLRWLVWFALALPLAACGSAPQHGGSGRSSGGAGHSGQSQGSYKIGRPYQIAGTWYYPREDWSYDQTGIASWYGEQFHGRYTADGEVFNLNGLTAAHRTLPLPSVVRVTNLENGRSIKLRVNDRGPYARGRIIDVSRRAAQMLGFEPNGTARVRVQIDVPDSMEVATAAGRNGGTPSAGAMIAEVVSAPIALPVRAVAAITEPSPRPAPRPVRVAAADPLPVSALEAQRPRPYLIDELPDPVLPATVSMEPVTPTQIYIQAGAFAEAGNARRLQNRLRGLGTPVSIRGAAVNGVSVYRVRVGPIRSVDAADALLDRVVSDGVAEARIVVD